MSILTAGATGFIGSHLAYHLIETGQDVACSARDAARLTQLFPRRETVAMDVAAADTAPFPILVLGGYGGFGSRISRLLARDTGVRIFIAGRSRDKARALAAAIRTESPKALVEPVAVDINRNLAEALAGIGARLVIHACGPFQGQDYAVAGTCIRRGVHYIDIADGRDFVCGFERLNDAACLAGVLAVSGASSVPGLSSTVVESLLPAFRKVEHVGVAIASGNQGVSGTALVAAILGYFGSPFPRWQDGRWTTVYGWQDLRRRRIGGPGLRPLGRRWLAACDVPDNVLLPERVAGLRTATFHAGYEFAAVHMTLWAMSWMVRLRLLPRLVRFAPLLGWAARCFAPFGSGRGGMVVDIRGTGDDGEALHRRWTLIAEDGDGPWVPCLPAVILARQLARSGLTRRGATPCWNLFSVEDFAEAARPFAIRMGTTPQTTRRLREAVA